MVSSIPIPLRLETHFSANVCAGATHDSLCPRNRVQKWGRSSPFGSLARVHNQRPSKTQPQCSLQCPCTEEVNGTLNRRVNGVFHAPFTFPRQKRALNFIGILAPHAYRGLRTKKCKRQIATITGRVLGLPSFFDSRL